MKAKKQKAGRPVVKDKKVPYAFTVLESHKKAAIKKVGKNFIDDGFRNQILEHSKRESK